MVLSLLVIIVVLLVAYIHFVEGFFSATLSAILAVISAVVALSFQEVIVIKLLQGKMGDMANSVVLVALFTITYLALRFLFDAVVPGNIQVPLALEKAGAGFMGLIAGICAGGIFAIAAQALPFGISGGGFARYEVLEPQPITVFTPGPPARTVDSMIYDALKDEKLDPAGRKSLILPADSMVLGFLNRLSAGGALAGDVAFNQVHPNYLDELFFQRLGMQVGAKRVLINNDTLKQVSVMDLFTLPTLPQTDSENPKTYPTRWTQAPATSLRSDGGNIILIVRMSFAGEAADTDNMVRLGTAAVRLVANGTNHLPIGTLDYGTAPFVRAHRPDDFLVVPAGGVVDLVYYVPSEGIVETADPRSPNPWQVASGVFIEAKRLGGEELSGRQIKRLDIGVPAQPMVARKSEAPFPRGISARPTQQASPDGASAGAASGVPLENLQTKQSPEFLVPLNVGRYEGDVPNHSFSGQSAGIREGKFSKLQFAPGPDLSTLSTGDFIIRELWVPEGNKAIQVVGIPPAGEMADPWLWASRLGDFTLVDAAGTTHKPRGGWAKVKQGTVDSLVAAYQAEQPLTEIPKSEARPTDVTIVFTVPSGTVLQQLRFGDQALMQMNLEVE